MKILINDQFEESENYLKIFQGFGYEKNNLIFCNGYEETQQFIIKYLEQQQQHIDLIITNESSDQIFDNLKANELCFFKNCRNSTYSNTNFRTSSIPIILYSDINSLSINPNWKYDAVIKKNDNGHHNYFIMECENIIRSWRSMLINDLGNMAFKNSFHQDLKYQKYHKLNIFKYSDNYFYSKTNIVSREFILSPKFLNYDWLTLNQNILENSIVKFNETYTRHLKYDRVNNERTVLHNFFRSNRRILLRDTYKDLEYEKNLVEANSKKSEECDFILKSEFPDFLNTTFFEVKKEDVKFYVKKKTKRPQISAEFFSHLNQVRSYRKFAENPLNKVEIKNKIGYETERFEFCLLAGRKEEKEEMKELFFEDMSEMFKNIEVITFEELEETNLVYLEKFNRLMV